MPLRMSFRDTFGKALERGDADFDQYSQFPDDEPEHGLRIELSSRGSSPRGYVTIQQWDMTEPPDDEDYLEDWEERPVLKTTSSMELDLLFDPKAQWRRAYAGDSGISYEDLLKMKVFEARSAIVDVAIEFQGHGGGSEEWVESVGD